MPQPLPVTNVVFLAALMLAVIAILRSPRKLHTAFFIVGVMFTCFLVGAGIGFALRDQELAAVLGTSLMSIGGIATSIERIRRYRKTKTKYNVKPL
jgi:lipopolysaccharide export LptBFGC system permease protein LptF